MDLRPATTDDDGVYKAVRAQLSGTPLRLDRIAFDKTAPGPKDPIDRAVQSARTYDASLVFWIEERETVTLNFYLPRASGNRVQRRTLALELSNRSSRFEVISVVAADIIEGLLGTPKGRTGRPIPTDRPVPPRETPPEKSTGKTKRLEIFAAYAGTLIAPSQVAHGVRLGLGFLPLQHLVVSASYTQGIPVQHNTGALRLTVISRHIDVPVAGRFLLGPMDLRMGIAWSVDLRTYSTQSRNDGIEARPDDLLAVFALAPFVSAAWKFSERIGLYCRLGAEISVNEKTSKIAGQGEDAAVWEPFVVKFAYQFGLLVQI